MLKAYALAGLVTVLPGCAVPRTAWKGTVEWPDDYSGKNIVPFMEAGAALAAAAAIREMVKQGLAMDPGLFWGCASPEQGLDVAVYRGPTPGLYYVMLEERFDRCSGPRYRVLDWWYVYAVTPQGEVVAEAPPPPADDSFFTPASPSNTPAQPAQEPLPTTPPSTPGAEAPTPTPSPAHEAPPPAEPAPASPPPVTTVPGKPEPAPNRPEGA
ncbi:hypothetical protein [Archangium violaceum]|uniref:hypothetical protein n=1 Tax=Archangium violaceum TaxID=83451 RepID=UPI0037C0DB4A